MTIIEESAFREVRHDGGNLLVSDLVATLMYRPEFSPVDVHEDGQCDCEGPRCRVRIQVEDPDLVVDRVALEMAQDPLEILCQREDGN